MSRINKCLKSGEYSKNRSNNISKGVSLKINESIANDRIKQIINKSKIVEEGVSMLKIHTKTTMTTMSDMREIAQKTIKKKKLTEEQIKNSLGLKRYEK